MVKREEGEFNLALMNVVADTFGINPSQSRSPDADEDSDYLDFVDLVLLDGHTTYYIAAKNSLNRNDIAQAFLANRLIGPRLKDGLRVEFIMMAKKIPGRVMEIADEVGIHVVQLSWDFPLPSRKSSSRGRISKLSHPRSWQIVTRLLWSGPSSIRQLSKAEGISYSWTHATVTRLIDMGVAERSSMGVKVIDLDRLMDGISWERPLNQLQVEEIPVDGTDYMETARELESILSRWNVEHAFTAFTAGGLYTGHSQRFDRLYIYIEESILDEIRGTLVGKDGGLTLNILRSDRNVFQDVKTRDGLTLASPSTTLLDLIGLGYKARAISREMVDRYAKTAHQ